MTFIGVDGGGTGSRAMVADRQGQVLARTEGEPGLIDSTKPAAAAANVAALVRSALAEAGVELPAEAMWAGLAGAGQSVPRAAVQEALTSADGGPLARKVHVGTDVEAAHADAFRTGPGLLIVAGTGSIARAVDPTGAVVTVGGWGALLGDEGSAYGLGLDALRAVVRATDGRGEETSLSDAILDHLALADAGSLSEWAAAASKKEVASLAVLVVCIARSRDRVATGLVNQACDSLFTLVKASVARTTGWLGAVPVALVGGLVGEGSEIREQVSARIQALGCAVHSEPVVPERGALRLAMSL